MREIARRLNADPNTIKQYAIRLGIQPKWCEQKTKSTCPKESAEDYKNAWLESQKKYPTLTKTELRKKQRTIYNWLYLNEYEWLKKNSSIRQKRIDKRVDWNLRDQEILKLVKEAVSVILHRDSKPERITIYKIGKAINSLALLEKHIDKLPETQRYLNTVIEDMESFQVRKVRWAVREMKEKDGNIKLGKVKEIAGLRGNISELAIEEINKAVNENSLDLFQF